MKQYRINNAYGALGRLANIQLPVRDSRNIYMLSKQLEDAFNFELEQEKKLIEKYHGVFMPNGDVEVSKEHKAEFRARLNELHNLDVQVEFTPVVINCDSLGDQRLTPYDIACLDGFVVFE